MLKHTDDCSQFPGAFSAARTLLIESLLGGGGTLIELRAVADTGAPV
jgi:hypothetical protein